MFLKGLIELVKTHNTIHFEAENQGANFDTTEFMDAIEEFEKSRWIPVSERLPTMDDADQYGRVQTYDDFSVSSTNLIKYWTPESIEESFALEFTHWKRMPEPPQEVE